MLTAGQGLLLVGVVLLGYMALLGLDRQGLRRLSARRRWARWLRAAVVEEERELESAIRPPRARPADAVVAGVALIVVVAASAAMERAASQLGSGLGVPEIIVGGLVLAAVTSLPNAVAAVYLAGRGRGAAVLSTTLNSNSLNVAVGLLLVGTVSGLGAPSSGATTVAAWYAGLTLVTLAFAHRDRGLGRAVGAMIVGAYVAFTVSLILVATGAAPLPWAASAPAGAVAVGAVGLWVLPRRGGRPPVPAADRDARAKLA